MRLFIIGDKNKFINFYNSRKINKFNKIVFVSNESKNNFITYYPNLNKNCMVCNNLIDHKSIMALSNEKIEIENETVLLNISRHDEHQKKISRIINITRRLIDDGYKFKVWLVGDGKDHQLYVNQVQQLNLENHIKFLGNKPNPYPYYKSAAAFLLTSDYEGFPVVYTEALIFNLPIITSISVSDNYLNIQNHAMITEKDEDNIYNSVKDFLDNGFKTTPKFNPEEFNSSILLAFEKLFNGEVL